eukprot:363500-Chlamydomonas_euryale.AAC.15
MSQVWSPRHAAIREEGLLGLWTGLGPNVARNAIINAAELASYDQIKSSLLASGLFKDNVVTHIASGGWFGCSRCSSESASLGCENLITLMTHNRMLPCNVVLRPHTALDHLDARCRSGATAVWLAKY